MTWGVLTEISHPGLHMLQEHHPSNTREVLCSATEYCCRTLKFGRNIGITWQSMGNGGLVLPMLDVHVSALSPEGDAMIARETSKLLLPVV